MSRSKAILLPVRRLSLLIVLISIISQQLQYCRVPKNGQAGISSKNKNDPRLEKSVENGFTTRKQRLL